MVIFQSYVSLPDGTPFLLLVVFFAKKLSQQFPGPVDQVRWVSWTSSIGKRISSNVTGPFFFPMAILGLAETSGTIFDM